MKNSDKTVGVWSLLFDWCTSHWNLMAGETYEKWEDDGAAAAESPQQSSDPGDDP